MVRVASLRIEAANAQRGDSLQGVSARYPIVRSWLAVAGERPL
jgi:hypothetical protein